MSSALAIFSQAERCLAFSSPDEKCQAVGELWLAVEAGHFEFDPHTPVLPIGDPGRPAKPVLVEPSQVKRRRLGSEAGRAALVHSVSQSDFLGIYRALDAV